MCLLKVVVDSSFLAESSKNTFLQIRPHQMYKAQLTTYTLNIMTAGRRAVSTFINLSHPTVFKLFSPILIKMKAAVEHSLQLLHQVPQFPAPLLLRRITSTPLQALLHRLLFIISGIELTIETWSSVIRCFIGFISNEILRTL